MVFTRALKKEVLGFNPSSRGLAFGIIALKQLEARARLVSILLLVD